MLLADLGATVIRIDRAEKVELGVARPPHLNLLNRSREVIDVDLKQPAGRDLVLRLVEEADALIEGFRPGVMERLGLGPAVCRERNPRLVYGRMTGWGQEGPLAHTAGHDINYIAITGALDAIGHAGGAPVVPLNLIGDFGGGALYLAFGLLAGIIEARQSGLGQVVDAAIVDGVASLLTIIYGLNKAGFHQAGRGTNILDGGAYFYGTYACSDGGWMAVGPVERRFHDQLLGKLGIDPAAFPKQGERERWPEARTKLAEVFATRPRDSWAELFQGSDACVSPVLTLEEAMDHPHLRARHTYVDLDGIRQPAPAPRFDRTPSGSPVAPGKPNPVAALSGWLAPDEIEHFIDTISARAKE
jgi:crotonobetainyl-CoA:carnitine CoA-transferase CaiB-like acyl-CoA transferase